jgi:hypothetical protein
LGYNHDAPIKVNAKRCKTFGEVDDGPAGSFYIDTVRSWEPYFVCRLPGDTLCRYFPLFANGSGEYWSIIGEGRRITLLPEINVVGVWRGRLINGEFIGYDPVSSPASQSPVSYAEQKER